MGNFNSINIGDVAAYIADCESEFAKRTGPTHLPKKVQVKYSLDSVAKKRDQAAYVRLIPYGWLYETVIVSKGVRGGSADEVKAASVRPLEHRHEYVNNFNVANSGKIYTAYYTCSDMTKLDRNTVEYLKAQSKLLKVAGTAAMMKIMSVAVMYFTQRSVYELNRVKKGIEWHLKYDPNINPDKLVPPILTETTSAKLTPLTKSNPKNTSLNGWLGVSEHITGTCKCQPIQDAVAKFSTDMRISKWDIDAVCVPMKYYYIAELEDGTPEHLDEYMGSFSELITAYSIPGTKLSNPVRMKMALTTPDEYVERILNLELSEDDEPDGWPRRPTFRELMPLINNGSLPLTDYNRNLVYLSILVGLMSRIDMPSNIDGDHYVGFDKVKSDYCTLIDVPCMKFFRTMSATGYRLNLRASIRLASNLGDPTMGYRFSDTIKYYELITALARELSIDYDRGFYFTRPIVADKIIASLMEIGGVKDNTPPSANFMSMTFMIIRRHEGTSFQACHVSYILRCLGLDDGEYIPSLKTAVLASHIAMPNNLRELIVKNKILDIMPLPLNIFSVLMSAYDIDRDLNEILLPDIDNAYWHSALGLKAPVSVLAKPTQPTPTPTLRIIPPAKPTSSK